MTTKFTIIKTISVLLGSAILALSLVPVQYAFAAATFNTDPQDFSTLRVLNKTVNPNCTTCWSTSVNANQGEVVSLDIYYHNTSNETAQNVRIKLNPQSTGVGNSQTFTAIVSADNAGAISGSVTVTLSSAQSLSFIPGSVLWRPNQTVFGSTPLPFGQNGSELFNGVGLNIGDIQPGFGTQGNVVLNMQVSSTNNNGGENTNGGQAIISTNSVVTNGFNSALLQGTVNPNGSNTNAWFEYGTSPSFGNTTASQTIGNGNSPISYQVNVNNLISNATYYYRAVASNAFGTVYGSMLSFTTSFQNNNNNGSNNGLTPFVNTTSATAVGPTYATLNGTVNPNGSNASVWFEYGTSMTFGNSVSAQSVGSGFSTMNYQFNLSGLQQNATYYYRIVASNSYGTSYGNTLSFSANQYGYFNSNYGYSVGPSVTTGPTFAVSNTSTTLGGSVNPNGSFATAWFEYGTTMALGATAGQQSLGSGTNTSTNITYTLTGLQPGILYYYRAVASNTYGTNYGDIVSFRTLDNSQNNNANIITNSASSVGQTIATLNGIVLPNYSGTNVWFEWGSAGSFSNTTSLQPINGNVSSQSFSSALVNLQPGTAYSYRAVAQNTLGTRYGNTVTFTTARRVVALVPTQPTTPKPVTPESPIVFASAIGNNLQALGQNFDYTLVYKNASGDVINNVVIHSTLPANVEYQSTNIQPTTHNGSDVSFNVGNVAPNSQGTITITVKPSDSLNDNTILMFSAEMNYTDVKGTAQTLEAPLSVTVKQQENTRGLTASIFSAFGTLADNWATLLLLGIIAFLGYSYFVRKKISVNA